MGVVRSSPFARGLATVFSGALAAQSIGLIVLPIFSRLFSPEAFGQLQVYQSLLTVLSIAVTSRFELALLSCQDDEAKEVLESGFCVTIILAFTIGIILFLLNSFEMVPILGTIPFAVPYIVLALAATGLTNLFFYRLLRSYQFRHNVLLRISQAGSYAIVGLSIGFINPTLDGLIIADLSGRLAAIAIAILLIAKKLDIEFPNMQRIRGLGRFLSKYKDLPKYSLPGSLANASGAALTPLLIYSHFGTSAAGQFGLIDRTMTLPMAMIISAASQVFAAQFSDYYRNNSFAAISFFRRIAFGSLVIAALGVALIWSVLPLLITFGYGGQWQVAGDLAQILVVAYIFNFSAGIVNQTLIAMSLYRRQMLWDFLWPVTIGIAWFLVVQMEANFFEAVLAHSLAISMLQILFLAVSYYSVMNHFARYRVSSESKSE